MESCPSARLSRFTGFFTCDSDKEVVAGHPGYDYLFKVRNLLDLLSPRFLSQYQTHEELSVDEQRFVLADSRNGYTVRLQIYAGKNSSLSKW